MGLLSKLFPRRRPIDAERTSQYFKSFTDYAPVFSTFQGGIYEQALTRAAVERFASSCSKLKPEVLGTAKPRVRRFIEGQPNPFMTWPRFLARCATLLDTDTTCAVVPQYDVAGNVTGVWPLKFEYAEVVELDGEAWMRFHVASGDVLPIEADQVCLVTRFQYESDFFGGGNGPINATLRILDVQDQAQENAVRNGANIRFIGRINGLMKDEQVRAKRDKFSEDNLGSENKSGLILYDNSIQDLKQVENESATVSADEMAVIKANVFDYFGINESILQNDFSEEQWGAYYESRVEPFAVQLGEGLTAMLFTSIEQAHGNRVMFSSNRLEYASNASKRNMVRDMTDRALMSINEGREVLQLPPVPWGDQFILRGEYITISGKNGQIIAGSGGSVIGAPYLKPSKNADIDFDLGGDDDIYNDTEAHGGSDLDD